MWTTLIYVNYPSYFQQWNLNEDIIFPNLSIGAKLRFLSVSLRLFFQVFSNSQKDFAVFKCYSSWTSQFFPVHDTMESWVFWKQAWAVLLKFSQFTKELGNWDFWSVPYTPLPSLKPSSYSKKMRWGDKQRISQKKNYSIHSLLLNFAQLIMSLH